MIFGLKLNLESLTKVALYDVVVWAKTLETHKNFVAGDIITIRLHGSPWGTMERKQFIIVPIEMTEEEARTLTASLEDAAGNVIHKRRYQLKLAFDKLGADLASFYDWFEDYQPFLDGQIQLSISTAQKEPLFYCKKRGRCKHEVYSGI